MSVQSFICSALLLLQGLSLGACSQPKSASASTGVSNEALAQEAPVQEVITGQLTLYGSALDAWWGVRDAQGQVTRLVFASQEAAALSRDLQNQSVKVVGQALPAWLGRPQLRVSVLQSWP